jgi:hypothetical protein
MTELLAILRCRESELTAGQGDLSDVVGKYEADI